MIDAWGGRVEATILRAVEVVAAILVVLEMLILFAGVVSRYVLVNPLVWSDELASTLFLWLGMLGAVVASGRSQHMRMGALSSRSGPAFASLLDALALVASLVFLSMVMQPSLEYALDERFITTPVLQLSGIWRALAMPAGIGLMLLLSLFRLLNHGSMKDVGLALLAILVVAVVLYLARPLLLAIGNYRLIVFFVLLVGSAVLCGIPIAFAFGLGAFSDILFTGDLPLSVVVGRMEDGMSHLILLSLPLFVFLGLLIEITGMGRLMVNFLASVIGHVRGGLHYVLIGAMYVVSGISGAKAADMAAVSPVLLPEMLKRGEKPGELLALLSATGAQTETVPPSLVLITVGSVTGVSIAALFKGGVMPSLVLAVMLCLVVWFKHRRDEVNSVGRASKVAIGRAFVLAAPAFILAIVIRSAVVEGIATATEVSTIGIAYTVLYGFIVSLVFKQRIEWRQLLPALVTTATLSGAVLLILGTATAMAWALTQSGFASDLTDVMTHLPGGRAGFLAVSIIVFAILGSVLEGIPAVVLFGPLLFPVARVLGIDEVQYAMVAILSMGLGLFAPPLGVGYYAACAVTGFDPAAGVKPILPYLVVLAVGIVLIAAVPWISTGAL